MNDDDVEDRLRDALRQFAGDAPPGATMLTTVTTESARRGRRARLGTFASGAAVLVAIGAAVPFALRGGPAAEQQMPAAGPTVSWSTPAVKRSATPPPWESAAVPTLVPSTVPARVVFPFDAPTGGGYGEPMVMLAGGQPTLLQTLPIGASVDVTFYDRDPGKPSANATGSPAKVNGQAATSYLWRWIDADTGNPADEQRQSLVWPLADGSWLRVDADPGVALALLTQYAEALRPGSIEAEAPFTFKLMPGGWTVDNISPTVVTFAPPGVQPDASFVNKIAVMLDESSGAGPKLEGPETVEVHADGLKAWLTTTEEGQVLQVPVAGGRSLLLQIGARAVLPEDLLIRFAAGIGVTAAARPGQG